MRSADHHAAISGFPVASVGLGLFSIVFCTGVSNNYQEFFTIANLFRYSLCWAVAVCNKSIYQVKFLCVYSLMLLLEHLVNYIWNGWNVQHPNLNSSNEYKKTTRDYK